MSNKLSCAPVFDGHSYNVLWMLGNKISFSDWFVNVFSLSPEDQETVFVPLIRTFPEDIVEFSGLICELQMRQHAPKRLLFCEIEKFEFLQRELVQIMDASAIRKIPSRQSNAEILESALKKDDNLEVWHEIVTLIKARRRAEFIEKVDDLADLVRSDTTVTQSAKRKRRDMDLVIQALEGMAK